MARPRNPSGTRRAHTRRTKTGKRVHVGTGNIKNRNNSKRHNRRGWFSNGTSRRVTTNGRLTKQRKRQVWSRVAWSTSGTASFMFFQQRRYTAAAIFGVLAVGFGVIDLGMTIHRKRKERQARQAKLESRSNRSSRNRTTSPRTNVKTRFRTKLETGVVAAAARKPSLDTEYRDAEKERREGKERIPVG